MKKQGAFSWDIVNDKDSFWQRHMDRCTGRGKKVTPWEKFDISGTVVTFFSKLTEITEEVADYIFYKFHCNICLRSKIIPI